MSDSGKRQSEVVHIAPSEWDMRPYMIATEIRDFLHSVKDEGSSIDSGAGNGSADLWVKVQGVEYLITIAPNLKVCADNRRGIKELQELRDAVAREWQPIETAPKDGREFLAFIPGNDEDFDRCAVLFWKGSYSYFAEYAWDMEQHYPTHWMPLPPPPEVK